MDAQAPHLRLSPLAVVRGLAVIAVTLIALSVGGQIVQRGGALPHEAEVLVARFDLDTEGNVPTWFSAALLLAAAGALWTVAAIAPVERRFARHWRLLAIIFVMLSLDEGAAFHERINKPVAAALHAVGIRHDAFHYAWIVPAAAAVVAIGLAYLPLLRQMPRATRRGIMLAGGLFVAATIGLEMLGGWYESGHGRDTLVFKLLTTAEEAAEMTAIIGFIGTLLHHLRRSVGAVNVWLEPSAVHIAGQRGEQAGDALMARQHAHWAATVPKA